MSSSMDDSSDSGYVLSLPPDHYAYYSPIKKGDHISKVKEFYGLDSDPQAYNSAQDPWMYDLSQYGILIFFDKAFNVYVIRFDVGFKGKLEGIGIGDTEEAMLKLKGEPAKRWKFGPDEEACAYYKNGFVRYDINHKTKRIVRMFR